MLKHRLVKVFLIFSFLYFISGCSSTKMTSTWKDPAFSETKFTKVMIIGVARDGKRRLFEDEFVDKLQKNGINAMASYPMFSLEKANSNRDEIKAQMEQNGIDTVIVTRIVDKTTELKYYPPSPTYVGPPRYYYRGWYPYYSMCYTDCFSPGYTQTYDVVKLECNVYNLEEEKLVFSGLSDTTTSSGIENKFPEIIKVLVKNILAM